MKGIIYKITGGGKTYYGSTTQDLKTRFSQHKKCKNTKAREIFECCENPIIDILEEVEVASQKELYKIEGKWIEENECINRCIMGRTRQETIYYTNHKRMNKIVEYNREYRNTEKGKEVVKNDNDKRKEAKRLWYLKNRERILQKQKQKYDGVKPAIIHFSAPEKKLENHSL